MNDSTLKSVNSVMRAGIFFFALAAFSWCLNMEAATRLRLGTLVPKGSSYYYHLKQMANAWKAAPGGGASLTIYPDGRLGGEAEMVRRMRSGQLQVGLLTVVGLSEIEPKVTGLQDIPMMFHSLEEVEYVAKELGQDLSDLMAAKGFILLSWSHAGWVHFFAKEPIRTIDDVRDTKIFSWAGNPETVKVLQKNGFHPVPLETKDIVPGLQTGMITSVPMPPLAANFSQIDTRAPYMLKINWGALVGGLVITKKAWDKLSPAQQSHMKEAAEKAGKGIQLDGRTEARESIEAMKNRGLNVIEPTPAELEEWRRETEKAYPDIKKLLVGESMFDKVKSLLEHYRKQ